MIELRTAGTVIAIVLFSAGCSQSDAVTSGPATSVAATSSAEVDITTSTEVEITSSTEFVDTNGTDPNPEQSQPSPAFWVLDPSFTPTPESTSLPLIVTEKECASGISPSGRIEATVSYTEVEVAIAVIVNSVGGSANCPGNPATPFVVQLTQPLGDRVIVGQDPPP